MLFLFLFGHNYLPPFSMDKVRKSKVLKLFLTGLLRHTRILVRGKPPISINDLCNYTYNNNNCSDKCL